MSGSRTHWKKPPTRVYDYNYNLGESYYKPQLRHAELKSHGRTTSPPRARSFAERFALDPVYGTSGVSNWSSGGRKTSLTDEIFGRPNRPTTERFPAPSTSTTRERNNTGRGFSEEIEFVRPRFNPSDEFGEFGKSKFSFGDRLLETAGAGAGVGGRGSSPRMGSSRFANETSSSRVTDDRFDDPFFQRGKRIGREGIGNLHTDSDFMYEDPFKSKGRRGFDSTSDDLVDDMKRDAESSASKFRSKLRMKRAQEEGDFGSTDDANSTESRIEKIRARAKARIAEAMSDDYSGLVPSKGFPVEDSYGYKSTKGVGFADDFDSAGTSNNKTVRISKRMMKTTYDAD